MKRFSIVVIVMVLLCGGMAWGQDCGKCPAAATCQKARAKIPTVYLNKLEQTNLIYHKKDCALLKNSLKIKLDKAQKKGYKPCATCFPVTENKTPEK